MHLSMVLEQTDRSCERNWHKLRIGRLVRTYESQILTPSTNAEKGGKSLKPFERERKSRDKEKEKGERSRHNEGLA